MKKMKNILLPLVGILLLSCSSEQTNNSEIVVGISDTTKLVTIDTFYIDESEVKESKFEYSKYISSPNVDSLYKLLESKSEHGDYFMSKELPLLFFRSGNILSEEEINALIISSPTDSTHKLELFSLRNNNWIKNDEINVESSPLQFDIDFKDFDFDGFKDLYIQCTASNGYSISRGHLITIDKGSKKMALINEARELGNMKPDKETKRISTEEVIWCASNGMNDVCKSYYKWTNGKLEFDEKLCPCETE